MYHSENTPSRGSNTSHSLGADAFRVYIEDWRLDGPMGYRRWGRRGFLWVRLRMSLAFSYPVDQREHVLGVLLLLGEDVFHQPAAGGVGIAQEADDFRVGFDGNPLRHQVLLDHLDERVARHILGVAARQQACGIE